MAKQPKHSTILDPKCYEVFDALYMARDLIREGVDPFRALNNGDGRYKAMAAVEAELPGPRYWRSPECLRALDRALVKEETAIAAAEAHELLMQEVSRVGNLRELLMRLKTEEIRYFMDVKRRLTRLFCLYWRHAEISGRVR